MWEGNRRNVFNPDMSLRQLGDLKGYPVAQKPRRRWNRLHTAGPAAGPQLTSW